MTLAKSTKFSVLALFGEVDEDSLVEPGSDEAEALALSLTHSAEAAADWTYSATAEDNGTAGILDGQPGIIYNGPDGNFTRLTMNNVDVVEHAITPPAAGTKAALAVYVNSVLFEIADEGLIFHNGEVTTEFNIDSLVGPLNEDDVVRAAIVFTGEDPNGDLDLAPGEITIS